LARALIKQTCTSTNNSKTILVLVLFLNPREFGIKEKELFLMSLSIPDIKIKSNPK